MFQGSECRKLTHSPSLVSTARAVKHVKSNAVTIAKEGRLLGMGSGQPNRVNSVRIALEKASTDVKVCVEQICGG